MSELTEDDESAARAKAEAASRASVQWVDSGMTTNFANVVNVQSTREQVDLFFGTNHTWSLAETPRVAVDLSNRIILTPHAAKRLWAVLGGVLKEYEARYGALNIDR